MNKLSVLTISAAAVALTLSSHASTYAADTMNNMNSTMMNSSMMNDVAMETNSSMSMSNSMKKTMSVSNQGTYMSYSK